MVQQLEQQQQQRYKGMPNNRLLQQQEQNLQQRCAEITTACYSSSNNSNIHNTYIAFHYLRIVVAYHSFSKWPVATSVGNSEWKMF